MADFTALKTAIQNAIKQNGNEEITGNLLQDVLLAIVTTLGEGNINNLINSLDAEVTARQQAVSAEAQARQLADSTLQGGINTVSAAITAINNAIGNGCVYAGIATPSSTPASGKVFYLALTAGTYTNFNSLEVPQGINILKNNGSTWSLDAFVGIDDTPTPSSNNLVKSGGVFNDIMTNGSAFDLSAYNNGTTYADLNAALTALNALPAAYKKGGMSIKYVQTSDNNYIQARCTANEFTTDITKWQGVDDEPTPLSENLVKSNGVYDNEIIIKEGVQKGTYGLILDTDNILINQGKNFLEKNFSYSPSLGKFIKRDGYGCIRFVEVLPSTTYYIWSTSTVIEFNESKEYVKSADTNPATQSTITTDGTTKYLVLNYPTLNPTHIYVGIVPYIGVSTFKNNIKSPYLFLADENFRGYAKSYTKTIEDTEQVIYRTLAYNLKQGYYYTNEGNEAQSANFSHSMVFDVELLKNYDLLVREVVSSSAVTAYVFGTSFVKLGYIGDGVDKMTYITYEKVISTYPTAKYFVVNCRIAETYPFVAIAKSSFRKTVTQTGQTQLAIKEGDTLLFNVTRGDSERIAIIGRPTIDSYDNSVEFFNAIPYDGLFTYTAHQNFNELRIVLVNSTTGSVEIILDKSVEDMISINSNTIIPTINNDVPSYLHFEDLIRSANLFKQISNPIVNQTISGNALENTAGKLCYYNGAIYGWKNGNNNASDHPETKYIYLFKYDISSEQVSVIDALMPEQVLTFDDSSTATVQRPFEGNIKIVDGYLLLVNCIYDTNNDAYVIQQKYDLSLNLVSTSKCTFSIGEDTYDFSVANLKAKGLAPFPNTDLPVINQLFPCGFAEKNGRYYGSIKVDEYFRYIDESTNPLVIFSTTDFINWRFEYIINERGQGEVAIDINNNIMTICIRPKETDRSNLQIVEKIDMTNWNVLQKVYITGQRSMPTFFRYDGKLYLLSPGSDYYGNQAIGRRNYKISYIDESDLRNSCKICDTFGYQIGANTNIVIDGNNNLYMAGTGANIILCKFMMPLQEYNTSIYDFINTTFLT